MVDICPGHRTGRGQSIMFWAQKAHILMLSTNNAWWCKGKTWGHTSSCHYVCQEFVGKGLVWEHGTNVMSQDSNFSAWDNCEKILQEREGCSMRRNHVSKNKDLEINLPWLEKASGPAVGGWLAQ